MKTLNKLFLFGLMALALSFGAYASGDSEPVAEGLKSSARLRTCTSRVIEIAQQLPHTIYEKAPVKAQGYIDVGYSYLSSILQSPLAQKMYDTTILYGTPLVSYGLNKAEKVIDWAVPALSGKAYNVLEGTENTCANLKRRFSKVEAKKQD